MQIHGSSAPENTKWGRVAEVTDGFLHVTGSITSMPPISVGSVSVSAGSTAYLFGKSGAGFYQLLSTSGTDGGILRVDSSVSVSTGSEVYVKGGSILTYSGTNYIDIPNRVAGSIVNLPIGSNFTLSSPGSIGVNVLTIPAIGSENYIKGGSIQTYSPIGIGSSLIVNSRFDLGSFLLIAGSISSMPSISVATGSESYIKGGSIQTYTPLGSTFVLGSVYATGSINIATNLAQIGSYSIQNISGVLTIDNKVAGSIVNWPGSLAISNFNALGSVVVIDSPSTIGSYTTQTIIGSVAISSPINVTTGSETYIKGGSIQIYNPIGVGSIRIAETGVTLPVSGIVNLGANWTGVGSVYQVNSSSATLTGSIEVFSSTGSVNIYGSLTASAGSEQWIKTGSISLLNSLGSTQMFGSVAITSPISVSVGSESYIKGGSIQTYTPLGSTFILGSVYATGSIRITNLYEGSEIFNRVAGSIVNLPIGSNFTLSSPGSIGVFAGVNTIFGISGTVIGTSGITNQGTTPWIVSGIITVDNRVAGSIVNMPIVEVSGTSFVALGSGRVILNGLSLLTESVNAISGTSVGIITGAVGSRINIYAYKLVNRDAGSVLVKWQDQATDLEGPQSYAVNGGVVESTSPPYFLLKTNAGSTLSLSTTGSVAGRVSYFWSLT